MRCSIGQEWDGSNCSGNASRHSWTAANTFTNNHRFADHNDWRLPDIDELRTLVYCSSDRRRRHERPNGRFISTANGQCEGDYQRPTIRQDAFPATPAAGFWSATPYAGDSGGAWGVLFHTGGDWVSKSGEMWVRLVRDGQ